MASLSRLRFSSLISRRYFSSILHPDSSMLHPDSSTPLTGKQKKSRDTLSLIRSEKDPEKVFDICRAAFLHPGTHLDRISFSVAMSKLTDSKSFPGIPSFLEELKTRPDLQHERFFSHVIGLYGQSGMLDHSIKTFQQMDDLGISRSIKSLNALLLACILAKKYEEVNRIFLEFPKTYNLKPDRDTYNTVIMAFCESGSSSSVYSILAEMGRNRCKPDTTSFRTILTGFFKEEKYIDVEKVLEIMEKQNFRHVVAIYNLRIKSLCRLSRSSEAKSLFEEMLSKGVKPTSKTYCHLICGFCKEGNLEEAKRLFDDMPKKGCDHFPTLKMLIDGLVSISKVDEAREVIGQIKKFTKNADIWKEIEEGFPQ